MFLCLVHLLNFRRLLWFVLKIFLLWSNWSNFHWSHFFMSLLNRWSDCRNGQKTIRTQCGSDMFLFVVGWDLIFSDKVSVGKKNVNFSWTWTKQFWTLPWNESMFVLFFFMLSFDNDELVVSFNSDFIGCKLLDIENYLKLVLFNVESRSWVLTG